MTVGVEGIEELPEGIAGLLRKPAIRGVGYRPRHTRHYLPRTKIWALWAHLDSNQRPRHYQ